MHRWCAAVLHKRPVLAYFKEIAHAARLAEPKRVAAEINLLHEGAIAVARMTRTAQLARQARRMAARLLTGNVQSATPAPITPADRGEDTGQRVQTSWISPPVGQRRQK